jgi:hypothetical protein
MTRMGKLIAVAVLACVHTLPTSATPSSCTLRPQGAKSS